MQDAEGLLGGVLGCYGSLLVLDLPDAVELTLVDFDCVHNAVVLLDGLEDLLRADQQFLLKSVALIVDLAVL